MLTMSRRGRTRDWLDSATALLVIATFIASWVTHILVCVASGLWGLLALGLLFFPAAILHGLSILVTTWT